MKQKVAHVVVIQRKIAAVIRNGDPFPAMQDETALAHLCHALEELANAEVRCDDVVRAEARIRAVMELLAQARAMECIECGERDEVHQLDTAGKAFVRVCGHCVERLKKKGGGK